MDKYLYSCKKCIEIYDYTANYIRISAHVSAKNNRSQSVKKYSNYSSILHEKEENGYVQVFVRREALINLQNVVNKVNQDSGFNVENMSPNEMSAICSILANCGILNEDSKN